MSENFMILNIIYKVNQFRLHFAILYKNKINFNLFMCIYMKL